MQCNYLTTPNFANQLYQNNPHPHQHSTPSSTYPNPNSTIVSSISPLDSSSYACANNLTTDTSSNNQLTNSLSSLNNLNAINALNGNFSPTSASIQSIIPSQPLFQICNYSQAANLTSNTDSIDHHDYKHHNLIKNEFNLNSNSNNNNKIDLNNQQIYETNNLPCFNVTSNDSLSDNLADLSGLLTPLNEEALEKEVAILAASTNGTFYDLNMADVLSSISSPVKQNSHQYHQHSMMNRSLIDYNNYQQQAATQSPIKLPSMSFIPNNHQQTITYSSFENNGIRTMSISSTPLNRILHDSNTPRSSPIKCNLTQITNFNTPKKFAFSPNSVQDVWIMPFKTPPNINQFSTSNNSNNKEVSVALVSSIISKTNLKY